MCPDWIWLCFACIPVAFFFAWPGCCCSGAAPCIFIDEDFGRSDDTDIDTGSPVGWSEDSGDFEIDGNALVTSDANAMATCLTPNPVGDPIFQILLNIQADTDGDTIRVGIGDHYCEVKIAATPNAYVRIYDASDVLIGESKDFGLATSTNHPLSLCCESSTTISAICRDGHARSDTTTITGDTVWLGTGATVTGTVSFDDLTAERIATGCNGECFACHPQCQDGTIPQTMQAVVAGLGNNICGSCTSYNGTYVLDQGGTAAGASLGNCGWRYIFPSPACSNCGPSTFVNPCNQLRFYPSLIAGYKVALDYHNGTSSVTPDNILWDDTSFPSLSSQGSLDCANIPVTVFGFPSTSHGLCSAGGSTVTISP
jgi:acetyltransferase-like isoleucine patch superfamily enzyme